MSSRRLGRWLAGGALTAVLLFGLTAVASAPVAMPRRDASRLRLSWSARPERIEKCRTLSAKELAEREEHMRQRVECEGRFATYALRVDADGHTLHRSVVRGAGLRHDRPIYLLREVDLPPGEHHIRISFTRRETTDDDAGAYERVAKTGADTGLFAGRAEREAAEHERRARAAIPPRLELDTTLVFGRNRAIVVTLNGESRSLRVLDGR